MTSDGRRGFVTIDRRWLNDPDFSDSALRFMLWLDSHSHEYLRDVNISRAADEIGWSRNRVKRTLAELEALKLVSTTQVDRPGGGTRTVITLHLDAWSDGAPRQTTDGPPRTGALVHDEARAVVHGEAPTTSNPTVEEPTTRTPPVVPQGGRDIEEIFEVWWKPYPRKIGKPAALRSFKAKTKKMSGPDVRDVIFRGTGKWIEHWRLAATEEQFIPHPATFLNQERYNDPLPAVIVKRESGMEALERIAARDNQPGAIA